MTRSAFWDDLANDLQDPEFRRHHLLETERVAAIDRMVNQLDDIRGSLGMTKADLARAIQRTPATVRRLLTSKSANPEFAVVVQMAAVLGYRVTLEPMSDADRAEISEALRARSA